MPLSYVAVLMGFDGQIGSGRPELILWEHCDYGLILSSLLLLLLLLLVMLLLVFIIVMMIIGFHIYVTIIADCWSDQPDLKNRIIES